MLRALFISLLISSSCFSQDTLLIDDGSIWFSRASCSVDFRCYTNIDDLIEAHCSDSITITSIELLENVYEASSEDFTNCRAQKLVDYLRGKHNIDVSSVIATPILMSRDEMKLAIQEQNFRTILIILDEPISSSL